MRLLQGILSSLLGTALVSVACGQRIQWLNATTSVTDFFTYVSSTPRVLKVSNNGYVAGFIYKDNIFSPYRYKLFSKENAQFLECRNQSNQPLSFIPTDISADGRVIVGVDLRLHNSRFHPVDFFIWRQGIGAERLELPAGYRCGGSSVFISSDGSTVTAALSVSNEENIATVCVWEGGKIYDTGLPFAQQYIEANYSQSKFIQDLSKRSVYFTSKAERPSYLTGRAAEDAERLLSAYPRIHRVVVESFPKSISPCGKFIAFCLTVRNITEEPRIEQKPVFGEWSSDGTYIPPSSSGVRINGYYRPRQKVEEQVVVIFFQNGKFVELGRFSGANNAVVSRGAKRILVGETVYEYDGHRMRRIDLSPAFTPIALVRDTHELIGLYRDPNGIWYVRLDVDGNIKPLGIPMSLLPRGSQGLQSINLVSDNGRYVIANVHTGYQEDYEPFQMNPTDIPVPIPVTVPTYSLAVFDTAPTPPAPSKKPQTTQKPSATKAGASQPKRATNSSRATQPKKPAPSRSQRSGSPPKKNTTPKRR